MIPTLHTKRLTLRAPEVADFEVYRAICASERARFMGGPMNRAAAWAEFTSDIAGWVLHGFGYWSLVDTASKQVIGFVGISKESARPELGWALADGFEGKGYAQEAAHAARARYFQMHPEGALVSYVNPANRRSVALANRLGCYLDESASAPKKGDLTFRHVAPNLITARLTLRPPSVQDWAGYLEFFTGPRAKIFGALKTEADVKSIFETQCARWENHVVGPYVVHLTAEKRAIGVVGVGQPEGIDEPELAWSIWQEGDEGKGYAFEAAQTVRVDYFNKYKQAALVSYIDPRNARSVALAKRLGCVVDPAAKAPFEAGVTYRHPAPDMAGGDGGMEAYV